MSYEETILDLERELESSAYEPPEPYSSERKRKLELCRSLYPLRSSSTTQWVDRDWLEPYRAAIEAERGSTLEGLRLTLELTWDDVARFVLTDEQLVNFPFPGLSTESLYYAPWKTAKEGDSAFLYTATLDYSATGEGQTYRLLAFRAESDADALRHVVEELGAYFAVGAEIRRGLPPEDDRTTKFVLTSVARKFLKAEASAAPSQRSQVDVDLKFYFNYS